MDAIPPDPTVREWTIEDAPDGPQIVIEADSFRLVIEIEPATADELAAVLRRRVEG